LSQFSGELGAQMDRDFGNECWHFLASLVLGCHPQHDTKSVVVLYSCHLTI
jgi:hypothetical protein